MAAPSVRNPDTRYIRNEQLPLDMSSLRAEKCQRLISDVGRAWCDRDEVKVEFQTVPRMLTDSGNGACTHVICDTSVACWEFLEMVDVSTSRVLILVYRRKTAEKPDRVDGAVNHNERLLLTVPILLNILRIWNISPSIIPYLRGETGYWSQIRDQPQRTNCTEDDTESVPVHDFAYSFHSPWLSPYGKNVNDYSIDAWCVVNYTRVDSEGIPFVSIFFGVDDLCASEISAKWHFSIRSAAVLGCCQVFEHYALFSHVLMELQDSLLLLEHIVALVGDVRLEAHMSTRANVARTVNEGTKLRRHLRRAVISLSQFEGLVDFLNAYALTTHDINHRSALYIQHKHWHSNLHILSQNLHSRLHYLLEKLESAYQITMAILSIQNGEALKRNTEEMTIMARATEVAGNETQEMSRRMERDARLIKFLAELTAFFLPMTAVATTFSMGFFSISGDNLNHLPSMPNLRFIWLYCIVAVPITVVVFFWWYWKRHALESSLSSGANQSTNSQHDAENIAEDDAGKISTAVEIVAKRDQLREEVNRAQEELDSVKILREANSDGDDDVIRELDERVGAALVKWFYLQRDLEAFEEGN